MSFALTTAQILSRQKTVTRRVGWTFLKPGDLIQAVEKGMGLKKGEKVRKLAVIRVVYVRPEKLHELWRCDEDFGAREMEREGFPGMPPAVFVDMFCASHRVVDSVEFGTGRLRYRKCEPGDEVNRIEFEYVD